MCAFNYYFTCIYFLLDRLLDPKERIYLRRQETNHMKKIWIGICIIYLDLKKEDFFQNL